MSLASSLLAYFSGKGYTNFKRARARTPNASHSFRILMLLAKTSLPPFYSRKGLYWRTTRDAIVAAFTSVIMQILRTVQVPCEHTVKRYTFRVLFLRIFRVQSVWRIQSNHFSGIFYPKKRSFRISDLMNPVNILKDKI